jgi:hypothetical protein
MTKRTCAFLLAAFLGALGPARAADAPLKVLRHLKFDLTYGFHSTAETKVSGFGGDVSGTSTGAGPSDERHGTLTADVVAATADGGLVADVFEEAPVKTATVRFGITADKMLFDPSAAIDEEEPEFLHYLARDLIQATDLEIGTTWTEKFSAKQLTGQMTYRVTAIDATNNTIAVAISGESDFTGITPVQTTTSGSLTYDTATSVPEKLSVTTRSLIHSGQTLTTKSTQLTATLIEDSFHKT